MGSRVIPGPGQGVGVTWELLPHVSRTFALTIPVLQGPLRDEVAIAYLLCRIADTIEDAEGIATGARSRLLELFLDLVHHPEDAERHHVFQDQWSGRVDSHHGELIARCGEVLAAYSELPQHTRQAIGNCLEDMIPGMIRFLEPSHGETNPELQQPCRSLENLEQYCYFVAGTVGILLTRLFAPVLPPDWASPERYEQGRRFGLGLQITNVLKDVEKDRRRGISYLPSLSGGSRGHVPLIRLALDHLDQAHHYMVSIPAVRSDLRLFCAWACHLALATLALIARHPQTAVKVGRVDLSRILERTRESVGDDRALEADYLDLRREVTGALRPA